MIISACRWDFRRGDLRGYRVALIVLYAILLQACSVELYTGLDQRQANEMVAVLTRQGIPAKRQPSKDGTMTVFVQETSFAKAVAILEESGLPKQEFATLGEVFKRDGLVSSPIEERAAMIYGLSQELSRTISDIDGVLSARVHLVLPENDPLRQRLVPSSASVFIRHREASVMADLIPQVKMLVANGISGLTYDNVSVVLVPVAATESEPKGAVPAFRTFFGLWLHPQSLVPAASIFIGLVALVVTLGGWLAYLRFRQRGLYKIDAALPVKKS